MSEIPLIYQFVLEKPIYVVYMFFNTEGHLTYVGKSKDFYGRLYHHLYSKHKKLNKTDMFTVRFYFYKTEADMSLAESYFIKKTNLPNNIRLKANDEISLDLSCFEKVENVEIDIDELIEEWNFLKQVYFLAGFEDYNKIHWRNF